MSENEKITPIAETSADVVEAIRRKTALTLPDDPSAAGMRAETIRRRFWEAICGADASVLSELTRIVTEANEALAEMDQRTMEGVEQARQAALSAEKKAASVVEDAKEAAISAAEVAILDEIADAKRAGEQAVADATNAKNEAQDASDAAEKAVKDAVADVKEQLDQAVEAATLEAAKTAQEAAETAQEAAVGALREKFYASQCADQAKQAVTNTANALKGSATGEAVRMDDVSTVEHEMAVKVRSKNILPYPYATTSEKTTNGITFTPNADRSITISGVATADAYYQLWNADLGDKSVADGGTNGLYTFSQMIRYNVGNKNISVYVPSGSDFTEPITIYPQIVEGTVETAYKPCIEDLSAVKVLKFGKNLINRAAATVNKGTLTFDGSKQTFTSTNGGGDIYYTLGNYQDFVGKKITIYFQPVAWFSTDNRNSFMTFLKADGTELDKWSTDGTSVRTKTFTIPENPEASELIIRQYVGYLTSAAGDYVTIDNLRADIWDAVTEWEDFAGMTEHAVKADGTVDGVTSLYPTTTLMTDVEGAIIDVEYNRDINKAFDELKNAIIALGGNV